MVALAGRFDKALLFSGILTRSLLEPEAAANSIVHALTTTALVLGARGSEDEAIAALLLDVASQADISSEVRELFGDDVWWVIERCLASDYRLRGKVGPSGSLFKVRSELQLEGIVRVVQADCTATVLQIHRDVVSSGARAWARQGASREALIAHFDLLAGLFSQRCPGALAEQFALLVSELVCLASPYNPEPMGEAQVHKFPQKIGKDEDAPD